MKEKRPWRRWTEADDAQLRAIYPTEQPVEDIARQMGRTERAIQYRARIHGLHRPLAAAAATKPEQPRTAGANGRFLPGTEPWNKGRRHISGGRSPQSQFKAGRMPHNTKPLGTLRVADGILQRKIAMRGKNNSDRWRSEHELVWVAAHGPVPKGRIVRFLPGMATTDPEQITIDRLECVGRRENMHRNSVQRLPTDLRLAIQLRGALVRRIRNREKNR